MNYTYRLDLMDSLAFFAALMLALLPFWGFYLAYLSAFSPSGTDGLVFQNRILDATFLLIGAVAAVVFLTLKSGYFIPMGILFAVPTLGFANYEDAALWGYLLPAILYVALWILGCTKAKYQIYVEAPIVLAATTVLAVISLNFPNPLEEVVAGLLLSIPYLVFSGAGWAFHKTFSR